MRYVVRRRQAPAFALVAGKRLVGLRGVAVEEVGLALLVAEQVRLAEGAHQPLAEEALWVGDGPQHRAGRLVEAAHLRLSL